MTPDDILNSDAEVLSQNEVERLLSQVQAEETSSTVVGSAGITNRLKAEEIQPCDFRQPAFLTPSELRRIRVRHDDFIHSLAARLAIYLRLEVNVQMAKLHTLTYQKFTEALPNPTFLTMFKADPLRGVCMLDMPPRLGLTMVDRLLGGPAHSVNASRDLSEIEIALHDQIARLILSEWCGLWQKMLDLRPMIVGHENNGRFLQSSAHDTIMLVVAMEVRLGDCLETLQLAFPYFTVEPLIRQLSQSSQQEKTSPAQEQPKIAWNSALDDVRAQVTAEWKGLVLTAAQLGQLRPGDIIPLDPESLNAVQVRVEQLPKFRARLGTCGKRWAVELLDFAPKTL